MRVVPIFPELRPYLEEACELNGDKSEFLIACDRDSNTNLRTRLLKIINRAGVKPWPKLFHNLRASYETDLAKVHPIKTVCDWIGNSITVAQRHYLQTTEEDYAPEFWLSRQQLCLCQQLQLLGFFRGEVQRRLLGWVGIGD